jgi:hypothetical protein
MTHAEQRVLWLIESMSRAGHGEREISAAVRAATGQEPERRSLVMQLFERRVS